MKNAIVKPVVCFTKEQGQYNAGATAHQHAQLGSICVLWLGQGYKSAEGDKMIRIPAAKAIELGNLLIEKGQLAMVGGHVKVLRPQRV